MGDDSDSSSGLRSEKTPTTILTDSQREFFHAKLDPERDVGEISANPEQYERNTRSRANRRLEHLELDLRLLEAAGHEDLVAKFYWRVSQENRIWRAVSEPDPYSDSDSDSD